MKRGLIILGGVVGVVAVAIFVLALSNIDSIVKAAIEDQGSKFTQVRVTLDEADISPTSGKGALRRLVVANPAGFKTESAFRLGEIAIDMDIGSITGDTLIIHEITISAPQVTYELGPKMSNIDAIRRNVDAALGPAGNKTAAGEKTTTQAGEDGLKVIIENLYIRRGRVNISASLLKGRKLSAALPDIHLKDIGKKKGGVSPGEVLDQVLDAVGGGASQAVASLNIAGLTREFGKVGDKLKGIGDRIGGGDPGTAIKTSAEDAGKALKKLFGR